MCIFNRAEVLCFGRIAGSDLTWLDGQLGSPKSSPAEEFIVWIASVLVTSSQCARVCALGEAVLTCRCFA